MMSIRFEFLLVSMTSRPQSLLPAFDLTVAIPAALLVSRRSFPRRTPTSASVVRRVYIVSTLPPGHPLTYIHLTHILIPIVHVFAISYLRRSLRRYLVLPLPRVLPAHSSPLGCFKISIT
jgi:hypothetical protein